MKEMPELEIGEIRLRPFEMSDVPQVTEYCAEWDVAKTTANIPHPYDESMAEDWISRHQADFDEGEGVTLAITSAEDGQLVGAVGLSVYKDNRLAELGYWIGKPHWNQGYATAAAKAMIRYAFENLDINRIQARHMTKNRASGRVMEKSGMTFEGVLRQSEFRWGKHEDAAIYSILREEFEAKPKE